MKLIKTTVLLMLLIFSYTTEVLSSDSVDSLRSMGKAFANVAKDVSPAVVFIATEQSVGRGARMPFDRGFGHLEMIFSGIYFKIHAIKKREEGGARPGHRKVMGQGSGFIISADGYILTNNHVVGDADKVIVKLLDGREFTAETVGADPQTDVAIIKIKAKNLPTLKLGNSDEAQVGEWVIAVGNPFGLSHSITAGIVSAKGRNQVGINNYENFIQTDAAINPGNSGGPLINLSGEVVGMNTAIFSRSGGHMGIGFAIPINMVRHIKDQLISKGSVTRGYLGISIQNFTNDLAKNFDLENKKGVLVTEVVEDTPAERGGVKRGDLIIKFNGKKIEMVGPFRNMVALTEPESIIKLQVIRDGKKKTVKIKIGKRPQKVLAKSKEKETGFNKYGFIVADLTRDLIQKYRLDPKESGVVVIGVEHSSIASVAGVRPGTIISEVNRGKVENADDFHSALNKEKSNKSILLLIKLDDYLRYITLSVD